MKKTGHTANVNSTVRNVVIRDIRYFILEVQLFIVHFVCMSIKCLYVYIIQK